MCVEEETSYLLHQHLMGHSASGMTSHYTTITSQQKQALAQKFEEKYGGNYATKSPEQA
ncbi:MAG: hypothetical protein FWD19_03050 [Defluviitaleaceae bacterium]|nr:hypothetical protein [Defluviitaleaceae bacterium]